MLSQRIALIAGCARSKIHWKSIAGEKAISLGLSSRRLRSALDALSFDRGAPSAKATSVAATAGR
jgi:hypothetical protein